VFLLSLASYLVASVKDCVCLSSTFLLKIESIKKIVSPQREILWLCGKNHRYFNFPQKFSSVESAAFSTEYKSAGTTESVPAEFQGNKISTESVFCTQNAESVVERNKPQTG